MKTKSSLLGYILLLLVSLASLPAQAKRLTPQTKAKEPARQIQPKEPARQITEVLLLPSPAGSILIAATLNGDVPATFILDTDWVNLCISDTLAARLKAPPAPEYRGQVFSANGVTGGWVASLQEITLGPWKLPYHSALVLNDKLFGGDPGTTGDHNGYLSTSVLRLLRLAVAVYPGMAKLRFFQPGGLSASERGAAGFGPESVEVPLAWTEKEQNYRCQVTLTRGEQTWSGPLILDTGSSATMVSADTARQLGLVPSVHTPAFGLGGVSSMLGARADSLRVGDLSVAPPVGVFYPAPGNQMIEVLGMDVLKRYNLLIDFVADKLYLTPLEDKK